MGKHQMRVYIDQQGYLIAELRCIEPEKCSDAYGRDFAFCRQKDEFDDAYTDSIFVTKDQLEVEVALIDVEAVNSSPSNDESYEFKVL